MQCVPPAMFTIRNKAWCGHAMVLPVFQSAPARGHRPPVCIRTCIPENNQMNIFIKDIYQ